MTIFGMSEKFTVQISIGNVIEFASIFFRTILAKSMMAHESMIVHESMIAHGQDGPRSDPSR